MTTIRWSSQAKKDLESISDYYGKVAPSFAERFEEQVFDVVQTLEIYPRLGRTIPEIEDKKLRELIYRQYRIMYHIDDLDEEVLILTILHSSRKFGGV